MATLSELKEKLKKKEERVFEVANQYERLTQQKNELEQLIDGYEVKHPASVTVHAPSGDVDACVYHANGIIGLFNFMGANTRATPLRPGVKAECSNCLNMTDKEREAKEEADKDMPADLKLVDKRKHIRQLLG